MTLQLELLPEILRSAEISLCTRYRYRLGRVWDQSNLRRLAVMLHNPSTADDFKDDRTVTKLIAYGQRWGFGGYDLVNPFAFRATDPRELLTAVDPVGINNDAVIREVLLASETLLVGWGNVHPKLRWRIVKVAELVRGAGVATICLGINDDGSPMHPLARGKRALSLDVKPRPWAMWP